MCVCKLRLATIFKADFLQTDQVSVERFNRESKVVNLQASQRPNSPDPFVDVVGGHPKNDLRSGACHIEPPAAAKRGSNRQASALDGEKQRSAAA